MLSGVDGLQAFAEVIAAALEANVTIVNDQMLRLAGTGPYLDLVHEYAPKMSAFAKALEEKETIIVEEPGLDSICFQCANKKKCVETFEICAPILWKERAVGIIGIFASNAAQKEILHKKESNI